MIATGVTKTPGFAIVAFKPANNPYVHVNDALFFIERNTVHNSGTKAWSNPVEIHQIELQFNIANYPNKPFQIKYNNQNNNMEAYTEYENTRGFNKFLDFKAYIYTLQRHYTFFKLRGLFQR